MSEKSKVDTSSLSPVIPPSTRVLKNPLLSASVTGIAFDDFPNKPYLLPPAAPPAPVPAPTTRSSPPVLSQGILNRETKSLVTVGQTSNIDNESLREINLNSSVDETQPAQIDINSNPLLEQNTNSDSILSQAASSFSALPSVASTVFSTFSKRIYPTSSSRERTPVPQGTGTNANPVSQLDIQPHYIQQQPQHLPPQQQYQNQQQQQRFFPTAQLLPSTVPPPTSASTPGSYLAGVPPTSSPGSQPAPPQFQQLNSAPPPPPPKLYTPGEVLAANPVAAAGPSTPTGVQNTYRLSAKKKSYAPFPGFSQTATPSGVPTIDPSAITAPIIQNNALQQATQYGYPPADPYNPTQLQHQSNPGESKSGLFSISNLVPSGVFQNISGLVQSAAGTIGQTVKQESVQQHQYTAPPQHQGQTSLAINYFGAPNSGVATGCLPPPPSFNVAPVNQSIPSATNYFTPPNPSVYPGDRQTPQQLQQQNVSVSSPQNFFVPQVSQTVQPSTPSSIQQSVFERSGQPRPLPANTIETPTLNLQSPQTSQVEGFATPATTAATTLDTPVTHIPPTSLQPSSGPTIGQYFDPGRFHTQSSTPVNIFDPLRPPSQTSIIDNTRTLYQPTPPPKLQSAAPLAPPNVPQPPVVGGSSSFRLQKGTRLYKSPLEPAQTTPRYINQPLFEQPTLGQPPVGQYPGVTHSVSPSIFNPFASSAPTSVQQSPALLVPQSDPSPAPEVHSVSSFAIEKPSPTAQPIAFFNPTTTPDEKQKTPEGVEQSEPGNLIVSNFEATKRSGEETKPITNSNTITSPTIFQSPTSQHVEEVLKYSAVSKDEEASPKPAIIDQTIEAVFPQHQDNTIIQDNFNPSGATSEESSDPLDQTLHKLLQEEPVQSNEVVSESTADFLPPPPQLAASQGTANPYRKELAACPTTASSTNIASESERSLASFFTPTCSDFKTSGDFNFFATPSTTTNDPANAFAPAVNFFNTTTIPSSESSNTLVFERQTPTAPTESVDSTSDSVSFPQLSQQTSIAPPVLFEEPSKEGSIEASCTEQPTIAPPLGFDNIVSEINREPVSVESKTEALEKQQPQTELNSLSNFFNTANYSNYSNLKTSNIQKSLQNLPGSTTYFDTFAAPQSSSANTSLTVNFDPVRAVSEPSVSTRVPSTTITTTAATKQTNEDQRIQNFFNNPPPQELRGSVGDLNYDLIHSGLPVKCQQTRSLTPASNLVEPPSSTCSEFSELNNSASLGQRQNFSAESSNKISPEEENRTPPSLVDGSSEQINQEVRPQEKPEQSADLFKDYEDLPEEIIQALKMANVRTDEKDGRASLAASASYIPAVKHWFYKRILGPKVLWTPFSHYDSALLETSLTMEDETSNLVAVEGGRYEVNIRERTKNAVYWEGKPIDVRRCSWFYKGNDSRYIPYEEHTADLLESEYKLAAESGEWHKKIVISTGAQVVFHGPTMIVHFQQQQNVDSWGGSSQTTTRPRIVKRDLEDFCIEAGESQRVDHLLFVVHGIGSACDLKFRSVEEVVDDFRSIAQQLVAAHYKNSSDMGLVGRVEILPISWHGHLHSAEMGIDEKLKSITLESIPKLRNFTNDTLLDVLFYTSPTFCQKIMNTVAASMNSVYAKYRQRHPDFSGGVSVVGHSLGSLILFDLLCHQQPIKESEEHNKENPSQQFLLSIPANLGSNHQYASVSNNDVVSENSSYTMGSTGTGQPFINYVQLAFQPKKFFAMGSPIGVFVTIRGLDKLGLDFRLPTCSGFYNIFHPFDPVAYRIEALVNPDMNGIPPVLIPHHKGRKRMHLELKDTMTRVGADLKQRFFDTFKNTLETVNFLGTSSPSTSKGNKDEAKDIMQTEVDQVLQMQMQLDQEKQQQQDTTKRMRSDSISTSTSDNEIVEIDFPLGKLNDSKRIDYVLQEAPLEFFNEYLFALSSHVCYWESEDTILFVMREIYSGLGINADSRVPQQSMTVERSRSISSGAGGSSSLLTPTT